MEPMTLGTPPTNSISPSRATPPNGSPFLPSFLLGEPQSPTSVSPKTKRFSFGEAQASMADSFRTPSYAASFRSPQPEKSSGPPIVGLFDTLHSPVIESRTEKPPLFRDSYIEAPRIRETSPVMDSTWVTVFGFPPSAASFIFMQMSHYGHIIDKKSPAKGNWMHLKFSSKIDARRALSNNGKVFGSNVMIGVMPCRDKGVLAEQEIEKENAETLMTPSSPRAYQDRSDIYESPFNSSKIRGARPLQSRLNDSDVFMDANNRPYRSTGIMSKALEYVFGR